MEWIGNGADQDLVCNHIVCFPNLLLETHTHSVIAEACVLLTHYLFL